MLYTTLSTLKTYIAINGNTHDDELTDLIIRASALLDTDIGQNLEYSTFTRRIDGSWSNRIIMERSDITDIVHIKDIRKNIDHTLDYIDGCVVYTLDDMDRGRKNIEIMYSAGFNTVPKDLEMYFLEYCKSLWWVMQLADTKVQKTKKLGDLSVTYFSPSELASESLARPEMESILKKYKNFQFFITQ